MAFDPSNLNFQRQLSNALGFSAFGIDQIRSVEWGRKYLWAIRFLTTGNDTRDVPPSPFSDYFPASDVEFPLFSLDSYNLDLAQGSFKIPQKSQVRNLSITFFDDTKSTLLKWFRDWVDIDIFNRGKFVSCLRDNHKFEGSDSFGVSEGNVTPVRTIQIEQLGPDLQPTGVLYNFNVYPEGEVLFNGESASSATTYTVNFAIVGEKIFNKSEINSRQEEKLEKTGIKTLGRFL